MQAVTLLGFGAIGHALFERLQNHPTLRITDIVVPGRAVAALQARLGADVRISNQVRQDTCVLLECAGHQALTDHVLGALEHGIETAVLSIGALSQPGLPEQLYDAAQRGHTQVHLLSGAIAGIDAISAARLAGLNEVIYTGRKPPAGWRGSVAESVTNLDDIKEPVVLLDASAREAARLYPKNANVAATVSLAGIGLDRTRARLIADPTINENIHEILARGDFGQLRVQLSGKPLPDNPKTSMLTVLSALRFLQNRSASHTI